MAWLRPVADALTGLRLVLSVALALLGWCMGADGIQAAAFFVLAAWTTDALDGPLARKSGAARQSWIGRHDLLIDMILATALWHYMRSIGLVHPVVAAAYLLLWGIILWRCGQVTKPLGAAFQGPVYLVFGLHVLARRPFVGRVMLAWVLANIALKWRTLTRRELPQFVSGLRQARTRLLRGGGEDGQ